MIIYFSGTGNSAYLAKRIAEGTNDEVVNLFDKIRNNDYSGIYSEKPFVTVCPTYAWHIPNILKEWLDNAKLIGNDKIYFVLSCGGEVGNAKKWAKEYCERKSKVFLGLSGVFMPDNYIVMFKAPGKEDAKKIILKSEPVIDEIINCINKEEVIDSNVRLVDHILSGPVNKGFYKKYVNDKKFLVKDTCIGCGLCEKVCVTKTIRIENGKPSWNGPCTHCMACISYCPKEAIEFGKATVGKVRYKCPIE